MHVAQGATKGECSTASHGREICNWASLCKKSAKLGHGRTGRGGKPEGMGMIIDEKSGIGNGLQSRMSLRVVVRMKKAVIHDDGG